MSEHLQIKLDKLRAEIESIKRNLDQARRKRDRVKIEIMTVRLESKLHAYRRIEYAIDTSRRIEQGILEEQWEIKRKATFLRLLKSHIEALRENGIDVRRFERRMKSLSSGKLLEGEYRELRRKVFRDMKSAI